MQACRSRITDVRASDAPSLAAAASTRAPAETHREDRVESGARGREGPAGWLDRLDRWLWAGHQREVEAYLAGASDVCELEARQRALERSTPVSFC